MGGWDTDRFEAAARRSQALHGNKHVLPVALAVAEARTSSVKAAEVGRALGGHLPPNRVLEGFGRLCAMGVMRELPYLGRPHPRVFEPLASSYWGFIERFLVEGDRRVLQWSEER
jgi:hypothetical protein